MLRAATNPIHASDLLLEIVHNSLTVPTVCAYKKFIILWCTRYQVFIPPHTESNEEKKKQSEEAEVEK